MLLHEVSRQVSDGITNLQLTMIVARGRTSPSLHVVVFFMIYLNSHLEGGSTAFFLLSKQLTNKRSANNPHSISLGTSPRQIADKTAVGIGHSCFDQHDLASKTSKSDILSSSNKYENIRMGLLHYKNLKGNTYVPTYFVVPSNTDEWPKSLWQMKLGSLVDQIRNGGYASRHEELWSYGFDLFPSAGTIHRIHDKVRLALKTYQVIYSTMKIPNGFTIPTNDTDWPEEIWGFKLHKAIQQLSVKDDFDIMKKDLSMIGYELKQIVIDEHNYDITKIGLLSYKRINGDMFVPYRFIIPYGDISWPKETWNLKLGSQVRSIRSLKIFTEKKKDLIDMGFIYESRKIEYSFDLINIALITYKELYGDIKIPADFAVPIENKKWPQAVWGMSLGTIVQGLKYKGHHKEHEEDLRSLGITNISMKKVRYEYEIVREAIIRYDELNGNFNVPSRFIIPENSDWNQSMWGMNLGTRTATIRRHGVPLRYDREDLESLGFHFDPEKKDSKSKQ